MMLHEARRWGAAVAVAWMGLCWGCDGSQVSGSGGGGAGAGGGGAGGAGGLDCSAEAPPKPADDWCTRIVAGPEGASATPVDWSAAHAKVRFFGPVSSYAEADQALAAAFASDAAWNGIDLSAYTAALDGSACGLTARGDTLGAVDVRMQGEVAIVTPGTGTTALPAGTKAVLIDVRNLPSLPGARDALLAAITPAITAPAGGLTQTVRQHTGMVDEVFSATNVYKQKVVSLPVAEIPAGGAADLPLAILTGPVLSPDAAEIAAILRITNRAWIVGEDVRIEVAEAGLQGVGAASVAHRYRDLHLPSGARVPDVIPADFRRETPECFATDILAQGPIPDMGIGPDARRSVQALMPFGDAQPAGDALADTRAALVIAHGAVRTFYPYFPTVGDDIDPRLTEVVASLPESPTRKDEYQALRRFGNALVDGHTFVFDGEPDIVGFLPLMVEDIDGSAVVRRSAEPQIAPGDTITAIAGVPAATWYETELARSGGATPGYNFDVATRQLLGMTGPLEIGLSDVNGVAKTVTVVPQPADVYIGVAVATSRPEGFLDDLGAPSLYYINLSGNVMKDNAAFKAALTAAAPATGLVLDMRGYPAIDHYTAARRLIDKAFSSPIFRVPVRAGLGDTTFEESSIPFTPLTGPSFAGPIALIVGHHTVSAAENFSTMLVDANRVTVVGRQSAGTNGNITGVQLPGHFTFTFTGMEVLHADAAHSVFHGIGILPDIDVALKATDFATGTDPELEAAVTWLLTQ